MMNTNNRIANVLNTYLFPDDFGKLYFGDEQDVVDFAEAYHAAKCAESVPVIITEPDYNYQAMGCGLEDRDITDRYDAMAYGWDCAIKRMFEEIGSYPLYTTPQSSDPVAECITNPFGENAVCAIKWIDDNYKPKLGDKLYATPQPSDAKLKIAVEALNRAYLDFDANAKYVCADRVNQALEKIGES